MRKPMEFCRYLYLYKNENRFLKNEFYLWIFQDIMTLKIIANVIPHNGKLLIGINNDLVVKLTKDMEYFKNITMGHTIVMGRGTWDSIGNRVLPGRKSIILTNNPNLKSKHEAVSMMTLEKFLELQTNNRESVYFVIGGGKIFNILLQNAFTLPRELYITETTVPQGYIQGLSKDFSYIEYIPKCYRITSVSEKYMEGDCTFRFIKYRYETRNSSNEQEYLKLLSNVSNGEERPDRTGVGTVSRFGKQMRFDISESIPLLTTKRVPWKTCIKELLWFLRGDTDSKLLEDQGIKIWKGNTSREFLDSRGLSYKEGVLGACYGYQWRFYGAEYKEEYADTSKAKPSDGIDQIMQVIETLKTDPSSRRMIVNTWNPTFLDKMVLPPCHFCFQFYASGKSLKELSCHIILRSNDLFLGAPFNIFEYAVLTCIIAKKCGMTPKELVYTISDAHIYKNHLEQVQEQLHRVVRSEPVLILDDSIKTKDFSEMSIDDFEIVGYFPDKVIKGEMAI